MLGFVSFNSLFDGVVIHAKALGGRRRGPRRSGATDTKRCGRQPNRGRQQGGRAHDRQEYRGLAVLGMQRRKCDNQDEVEKDEYQGDGSATDSVPQNDHAVPEPVLIEQLQLQPHAIGKEPFSGADYHREDDHLSSSTRPALNACAASSGPAAASIACAGLVSCIRLLGGDR